MSTTPTATTTPAYTTFHPVTWIVRLVSENDGNIYIGPFSTEADGEAWLENMPEDDDIMYVYVEAMAPPVLSNGEPNY